VAIVAVALVLGVGGARAGGILGPTSIAIGFGSVWVGMGNGDIVRLDARTGVRQARLRGVPTSSVHGLTVTSGAVWGLRGRVVRIDPRRNSVREVRRVGSAALFAIGPAAGAIWVADDGSNELLRISAPRTALTARVRIPGRAMGLATSKRDVLVVSAPTKGPITGPSGDWAIRRIDPATNRASEPLVRLTCYPSIAIGPRAVWTADECDGTLTRRRAQSLVPTGSLSVPLGYGVPVVAFGDVWLIGSRSVLRIDPRELRIEARIPTHGVSVAVGAGGLWVLDLGDGIRGAVRKIDPATNRVVRVFEVGARR
jgi:DNA-binding beta-propeller fold protein YncE